jgi:hypothetical protein
VLGASYCIQPGDVCYRSTDCCTGLCEKAAGAAAGVCKAIATTGSGSCTQDGVVCSDCTNCCSRNCAPYARSGVKICQPASGCKLTNNLCQKSSDCCGGDPTASVEGAGNVTCELAAGLSPPLGTCRNPMGCQPRGNVCGKRDGDNNMCGGNAREDCCDCPPPKFNCCKPDNVGIYRCFGGGSGTCPTGYTGKAPCCIAGGERCQFSAECCDGTPCVPDDQGVLRCLARPPAGTACVNTDGRCTTTGDCCSGLTCDITPGQTYGRCAAPPAPPPPPPDAGTTDASPPTDAAAPPLDAAPPPVCSFYGQSCAATPCCTGTGLVCVVTGTHTLCAGGTSCVCTVVID